VEVEEWERWKKREGEEGEEGEERGGPSGGSEHTIYEVTGETPSFKANVVQSRPESTTRHKRNIFIVEIAPTDLNSFREAVAAVPIDNETVDWDCQDYVLEVLDHLEEELVIDGNDGEYIAAKEEGKSHYGPLL
jgi:hypothetical protein